MPAADFICVNMDICRYLYNCSMFDEAWQC